MKEKKFKTLDVLEMCDACPVQGYGTEEDCLDCPNAEKASLSLEIMAAELATDMYEIEANDDNFNDFLRRMEEFEDAYEND